MKLVAVPVMLFTLLTMVVGQSASFDMKMTTWRTDSSLFGGKATISTDGGVSWRNVNAGQFKASFLGDSYDTYDQSWITYCTDADFVLKSGYFNPVDMSIALEKNHNPIWTGDPWLAANIYSAYGDSVSSDSEAVGLQLAIWNALYNTTPWNLGYFQVSAATGNALDYADNIYSNLDKLTLSETATWWMPVNSNGDQRNNQGLIGRSMSVPEPSSILSSILVLFLGAVSLKRKK